jgi:hypothetical protein
MLEDLFEDVQRRVFAEITWRCPYGKGLRNIGK